MKKPSIKYRKKKAWEWFSVYIRLKYSDKQGYCQCITCDKKGFWKGDGIQAGHGVAKGRGNGLLFCEEVVRPQCARCNLTLGGRPERYIPILIEWYGKDGLEEFTAMKLRPTKYKLHDYIEIEKEYKELALKLAEDRNIIL